VFIGQTCRQQRAKKKTCNSPICAMPVASTVVGEVGEILALWEGLVRDTPNTRSLELRVGDITVSSAPAQHMRSKVAAKPPASASTREQPGRAATTAAERRACNRAAAFTGQPPPFPRRAVANPNSEQDLHQAPAPAPLSAAPPPAPAQELHQAPAPAPLPAAPPPAPAPPAAPPQTRLSTLEPLRDPPPPPPPHDALVLAARGSLGGMQLEGEERGSTRLRGTPPPPARTQQPPESPAGRVSKRPKAKCNLSPRLHAAANAAEAAEAAAAKVDGDRDAAAAATAADEASVVANGTGAAQPPALLLSDFVVSPPGCGGMRLGFARVPAPWPSDRPGHAAQALDAVKATAGWEPAEVSRYADGTPRPLKPLPKRYVRLLRDIRAATEWAKVATPPWPWGKVWLERPDCKSQADARARALIELQMLLNFWGAAADGMPESDIAGVCYEVAMGDVELDQGPMNIIMSYLHKEDREN
jgi:hypothetical protein